MDSNWQKAWVDAVVDASVSGEKVNAHRARMVQNARQRFLWSTVAKQWATVFEDGQKKMEMGVRQPPTMREVFGEHN